MNKTYLAGLTKTDWLCLSFLEGIGPARLSRLCTYLSQLQKILSGDDTEPSLYLESLHPEESVNTESDLSYELLRALKWPEVTARQAMDYLSNSILTEEQKIKRDDTLNWLEEKNHHLVLQEDKNYPEDLKEINVAPAFLYVEGNEEALMLPKVGIVGARKCTRYGRDVTFQLAKQLSHRGICVVSGGAMGIDTAAHQGALEAQTTPTLVVMGTGLKHRYPNHNTSLFDQVLIQRGALISEYPLTIGPKPHLFPPRNRIISGLSMGVLVSEASIKSGSLISASYAVQQNREVFALPGRLTDSQSKGCHQLLRQGATLVRDVDDILTECQSFPCVNSSKDNLSQGDLPQPSQSINVLSKSSLAKNKPPAQRDIEKPKKTKRSKNTEGKERHNLISILPFTPLPNSLSDHARRVARILEKESAAMDFDTLIRQADMATDIMMQALMELELSACVVNHEGLYSRC